MMSLMTIWPVGNFTDVSGVCIRISRALPYLRAITSPPKRDVLQKKGQIYCTSLEILSFKNRCNFPQMQSKDINIDPARA